MTKLATLEKKKKNQQHVSMVPPENFNQGPVVQSVVSLTSSLSVILLTVLADSIHNILKFFAEKMWVAFALQKLLTFFQQKISAYLRITGTNGPRVLSFNTYRPYFKYINPFMLAGFFYHNSRGWFISNSRVCG